MIETPTLDDLERALDAIRAELKSPKIGLLQTRALYRRFGELARQVDAQRKEPQHDPLSS